MILLDDREDTHRFLPLFKPYGVDVDAAHLECGDFAFAGNGSSGDVMVGIERKTLTDLFNSMRERRLQGKQLPRMFNTYSPEHIYLLVEGVWRPGANGVLEVLDRGGWHGYSFNRSGIQYGEIVNFLTSLTVLGNVKVLRSQSDMETAALVSWLYKWYAKPYEQHKTLVDVYAPLPLVQTHKYCFREPTLVERVAAQLPGIDSKARAVGKHFKTVKEMVNAKEKEWLAVDGVGKTIARKVKTAIG